MIMDGMKNNFVNIVADTHIHFYPCYDLNVAVNTLRSNLASLGNDSVAMAFLAERYDCHYFRDLKLYGAEKIGLHGYVQDCGDALLLKEKGFKDVYLLAGRQVITSERLEILALTTDMEITDGLPAREVIQRTNDEGAVAVLSWAPGKWFGKRGEIVQQLISNFSPNELLIGDTTLRPWCWFEPVLMKKGEESGFRILAGSDPLPFAGEEKVMGKYVSTWQMQFDGENPVGSVRDYLKKNIHSRSKRIGRRGLCFETLRRLYKNYKSK